jgi:hypothetical protein
MLRLDHDGFAVRCPLALLSTASYPVLVHRPAASLRASSPHSVALMQLRFASFAVVSLWKDLHLQDRAHAGRTTKKAGKRRPPSPHPVMASVATAARLVGREKPDALALRMSDVGVDCAAILRRRWGGLHRSRGTRVDGTRRDVVGEDIAVGRALGSVSRTDAKAKGGGSSKKHDLHDLLS